MNCRFCDSHCHPSDKQFQEDLYDVIQNAKNNGLEHIIGNACGCCHIILELIVR